MAPRPPEPHRCPGPGCEVAVPYNRLCCLGCWSKLPKPLQRQLWSAAENGSQGSREHELAVDLCLVFFAELDDRRQRVLG